ncbi:MAG: DUF4325 domain-containing protein [Candidatus Gracilibacteria bacterium]|nr:DUF4325 domain-containing protein [Candidatus Gracilibacteria bacterium]
MKTIKLLDFGNTLVSREVAKKVFILAEKESFNVVFDGSGIDFISSSFADELFAKGKNKFGKNFKISNLNDKEFIIEVIKQSLITRDKFTCV